MDSPPPYVPYPIDTNNDNNNSSNSSTRTHRRVRIILPLPFYSLDITDFPRMKWINNKKLDERALVV